MKLILKWLGAVAVGAALLACGKTPQEPTVIDHGKDNSSDPGTTSEVTVPDKQEVNLTVGPMGSENLTTKIEAYADWTISPEEEYNWVAVTPGSVCLVWSFRIWATIIPSMSIVPFIVMPRRARMW